MDIDIESLLWRSEGDSLDFKRDQYKLADPAKKAELIKDILAFANSWKSSDAFILIGVAERAGRSDVVGIDSVDHLKDGDIQQLVNGKTNTPVTFECIATQFEGKPIDIIRISVNQDRPVYLKKRFQDLDAEDVFVRRGSSTERAKPEEVAQMGAAAQAASHAASRYPTLAVSLVDVNGDRLENPGTITSYVHRTWEEHEAAEAEAAKMVEQVRAKVVPRGLLEQHKLVAKLGPMVMPVDPTKLTLKDRWHNARMKRLMRQLYIRVENTGRVLARGVRVQIAIRKQPGLSVYDGDNYPQKRSVVFHLSDFSRGYDVSVNETTEGWLVQAEFAKVQPGANDVSDDPFYIGGTENVEIQMKMKVYGDDLPEPLTQSFPLSVRAERDCSSPLDHHHPDDSEDDD